MEGSGQQNAGSDGHIARKRAERIRRVEEAAARMFAERGYDRANFDDIARNLGLRGPSLYHYFASKEEMFLACVEHSAAEVMRRLEAIAGRDEPPGVRLRRMFAEQVLIEIRDYPAFAPLFFRVYVPVPRLAARVAEIKRAHGDIIRGVAAQCAAAAGRDKEAARVALMAAFGALAYIQEWYSADGSLSAEMLADQLAGTLVAPFLAGTSPG
ncbi:MAG TPA: TetR/AcrR family transcriptional regulator [Streptosporangiaceae bacterium]|jgi:AcrR family transcriptional regulator